MRVLVIGGSGRTGKLVIDELLRRGHQVNALVRDPSSLEPRCDLGVVKGTPLEKEDVRQAFRAGGNVLPEAVIVTLNAPRASDSPFAASIAPPRLMADSNSNVITVMKEFRVRKIVIMQAFGVGESWSNMNWLLQLLMKKSNMAYQYDDHNLVNQETTASGVDYVLVRPSRLEEGDAKLVKEWPNDGRGVPMMASITRKSVARWLVNAVERTTWDKSAPVITN